MNMYLLFYLLNPKVQIAAGLKVDVKVFMFKKESDV